MRCRDAIRLMPLFLDSELSPEVTLEMEEHFESCTDCGAKLENERRLEDAMRATLLEPGTGDRAAWDQAVARATRSERARGSRLWARVAAAAAFALVLVAVILWRSHRELDLARAAAADHVRFVTEIDEESLPRATMRDFLVAAGQALPRGSTLPAAPPAEYRLLKTGQCKLDGSPVAYLVVGRGHEPITVFMIARPELGRFPAFAARLRRQRDGVACRVAGRNFYGTVSGAVVGCAVGRPPAPELRKLVHWAVSG